VRDNVRLVGRVRVPGVNATVVAADKHNGAARQTVKSPLALKKREGIYTMSCPCRRALCRRENCA
jgi:hypothetical protein